MNTHKKALVQKLTSQTHIFIVDVIKNLRLYEYFDFVLTSSMAGYEKPDKKIYEQALKLAGNMKPTNALHIGDDAEK